jgi:membrane protein YqaA with SNARE-associated domain
MNYFYIFVVSFISATLFPMGSEALFGFYISQNLNNNYLLLAFATLGNTIGACLNYLLGLKGFEYLQKKRLLNRKYYILSKRKFRKFGLYSLLLSWVPIIGDPITFVAGIIKVNFLKFFIIVLFAKFIRYYIIMLSII